MRLVIEKNAFDDLMFWLSNDRKMLAKIMTLIEHTQKQPFEDLGKPEALRHQLASCWSRRINHEHRLVYRVENDQLILLACRYHY